MTNDFEHLNNKIKNKEPFESVDEFLGYFHLFPVLVFKVPNGLEYAVIAYNQLTQGEKVKISSIIEDNDLTEVFNEKLNLPKESTFFYNKGMWIHPEIDSFNVFLDRETSETLLNLDGKIEVQLFLSKNKVATYEPESLAGNSFLSQASKKAVQMTLGFSLLLGVVGNLNAVNTFFDPKPGAISIELDSNLSTSIQSLLDHLSHSNHPHIVRLKAKIQELDLEAIAHFQHEDDEFSPAPSEELIQEMILSFYKDKNPAHIEKIKEFIPKIASSIIKHSKDNKINYKILLSILKTESDFNQNVISHTNDYSLAQVNYEIWSKEFYKVKKEKLDKNKLKTDIDYSIRVMTQIIGILESRHSQDPLWYARYHSSTPSRKMKYARKVNGFKQELEFKETFYVQDKLKELNSLIKSIDYDLSESENLDYDSLKKLSFLLNKIERQHQTVASN